MFKSFFNKFSTRIIACPSCGQRSRVPVKPGKSLLITCPACSAKFEIKFENPLNAAKSQFKNPLELVTNLNVAQKEKLKKYMPLLAGLVALLMFKTCFSTASIAPDYQNNVRTKSTQEQKDKSLFDM
tara:strand:+ start:102 stop:482 length:381 start_codon:yes stop_codon:yes gene_type:complete